MTSWRVAVAAVILALFGLAACAGGPVQGHAEIGPDGEAMELGTIGTPASGAQRLDLEAEVTDGAGRIELVAGDGTVAWSADVTPGQSPIRAFAEIEGPGPWTVRLVATETPFRLDYRLDQ
ncbi:MAG TPA: hypothetical protein VFX65_11800 [Candidatus Limnocylindrales bacterium]|nr:hypothetical protein [Candidatus Limnocylindrales bacterium]